MSALYPHEILQATIVKGEAKAACSTLSLSILGFLGGAFISLG